MTPITLTSHGHRIDTDPDKFGFLRQSNDLVKDTGFLENRIEEDEYLFFRDILDHAVISAARQEIVEKLDVMGEIDAGFPEIEAIDSGEIRRNTIGIKSYLKNFRTGTAYRKLCH